jgi:glycosyltransferase involved in cell wall biosynthesis
MLKLSRPSARVVMVALQPRSYSWFSRQLIRFISPDIVFVQNELALKKLKGLGCQVRMLPSGVDLNKFVPASPERKAELRAKYGLDSKAFTTLHVGHMTKGRNIELLIQVRRLGVQVVLVGSSLNHEDRGLLTARLRRNGVIVLDEYFPDIEELYQLSDCYLFPVFSSQACIGIPLSILEAMACNLPVVTVRYGNLPGLFEEGQGLVFADTPDELLSGINAVQRSNGCRTREKVMPYSWQNVARRVMEQSLAAGVKN